MKKVKFCKDCKWSFPNPKSDWELRCKHPVVNSNDEWALAYPSFQGTLCRSEREVTWFAKCGMKGKLWENKNTDDYVVSPDIY